jgi:hypothetical protein
MNNVVSYSHAIGLFPSLTYQTTSRGLMLHALCFNCAAFCSKLHLSASQQRPLKTNTEKRHLKNLSNYLFMPFVCPVSNWKFLRNFFRSAVLLECKLLKVTDVDHWRQRSLSFTGLLYCGGCTNNDEDQPPSLQKM